jgi:hypothetical protein
MPDSSPASPGTRALSTLKAFLAVTACVVAVIFANHCFARQNLRAFDPQEVGTWGIIDVAQLLRRTLGEFRLAGDATGQSIRKMTSQRIVNF